MYNRDDIILTIAVLSRGKLLQSDMTRLKKSPHKTHCKVKVTNLVPCKIRKSYFRLICVRNQQLLHHWKAEV